MGARGIGPMDGATTARGRSCCNPPDAVHNHFFLTQRIGPRNIAICGGSEASGAAGLLATQER
jgi:hypothetical protein